MRYAKINPNDIANGEGVCVSLFVQGCPHRCKGCFNPETWDFGGGEEFTLNTMKEIMEALDANGIQRNFSILGGEPLAPANRDTVLNIIKTIKFLNKEIKIYVWTGYYLESIANEPNIKEIISLADYIIDGPFEEDKKDLSLKLRGSSNQRIWDLTNIENYDIIK
jgi:anaerobic ribonucleoside-triphosphate reductase activating protein